MMPLIDLTDDEFHWVCVALENSKDHAERNLKELEEAGSMDDALDYGFLVSRYNDLQHKFPPPSIGLDDIEKE